jgi:hypothetical protein
LNRRERFLTGGFAARLARWIWLHEHQVVHHRFSKLGCGDADILLGTQMTLGPDF